MVSPSLISILAISAAALPFITGLIELIFYLVHTPVSSSQARHLAWLTMLLSAFSLVCSVWLLFLIQEPQQREVGLGWMVDSLSVFFMLLVNSIAMVASWNAVSLYDGWQHTRPNQSPLLFHALLNLFHASMLFVTIASNLIALWIAIEATTLVTAWLVAFEGRRRSWEAAWKYLMITSTGIIFALLGTMFLTYALLQSETYVIHSLNWAYLYQITSDPSSLLNQSAIVKLSFLFILVGYGTKAGLAPMHTWLPDGHGEAPAPISAMLSGVLLKSALYAILRFYILTNRALPDEPYFTSRLLLAAGLISLIIAVPMILKQNGFKRVLAYHSLEHMGIITFGLGIGGTVALFGALLHSLNHALAKALLFLSYGNITRKYRRLGQADVDSHTGKGIRGLLLTMPTTAIVVALGGLALVGAPPFNIFTSELLIVKGALEQIWPASAPGSAVLASLTPADPSSVAQHTTAVTANLRPWQAAGAVALFLFSTGLIFFGLVRHLAQLLLPDGQQPVAAEEPPDPLGSLPPQPPAAPLGYNAFITETVPLLLLLFFVILFGVWLFPPLVRVIEYSVAILQGM